MFNKRQIPLHTQEPKSTRSLHLHGDHLFLDRVERVRRHSDCSEKRNERSDRLIRQLQDATTTSRPASTTTTAAAAAAALTDLCGAASRGGRLFRSQVGGAGGVPLGSGDAWLMPEPRRGAPRPSVRPWCMVEQAPSSDVTYTTYIRNAGFARDSVLSYRAMLCYVGGVV